MRRSLLLYAAAVAALTAGPAPCQFSAGELWAKALEAKGGVHRLHQVKSVLLEETYGSGFRKVPFAVTLYVFPGGLWEYDDESDSVLGKGLTVSSKHGVWWSKSGRGPTPSFTKRVAPSSNEPRRFIRLHAVFLLESATMRPILTLADDAGIGFQRYHVLVADYQGAMFRLYIDPKTFLVARVQAMNSEARECLFLQSPYDLKDYVAVDSILMPTLIKETKWYRKKVKVELNVDYRPDLFEIYPTVDDGPDAWRNPRPSQREAR